MAGGEATAAELNIVRNMELWETNVIFCHCMLIMIVANSLALYVVMLSRWSQASRSTFTAGRSASRELALPEHQCPDYIC